MVTLLKMAALVLSLGADTLMMSVSLGMMQTKGKLRIALTFACAEAMMPMIGFAIGQAAGHLIGHFASLIGGLALVAVAIWLLFFEDDDEEAQTFGRVLAGWTLIATAFSVSLDELAVGFSIGMLGVPVGITILLIALQAFGMTLLGLTFGAKLKPYLGEWAEKLAGIVLLLLGLWMVVMAILSLR